MFKHCARYNYLACIYLAGMVFFTLFRLAETMAYCATTEGPDDFGGLYGIALWKGFRFDTAVSAYVLALPLLMMIAGEMARIKKRWYYAIAHYAAMALYTVCFFACAADIPYFCYFFTRLDNVALTWMDDFATSASMIVSEPMYMVYLIVFIAVAVGWWLLGRVLYRRVLLAHLDEEPLGYGWSITIAVVLLGLGFLGMRGKLTKIPMRVSTAYFCNDPFLNQIGLNPVFTFMKSVEGAGKSSNQELTLASAAEAAEVLREQQAWPVDSTLAEAGLRLPENTNVVVVLMESLSAYKTSLQAPSASLSPCLDSLMGRAMTFRETWSAGIHTHNGIYATLYGHPALMARNIMKYTPMPTMCGLPQRLSENGYSTAYFMAHDEDFDGMRGFLFQNGFDFVVGQHSYPRSEVVGTWGIPDHMLFDHALEHCDSMAAKGPFFACVMTCSDHGPYIVPEGTSFRSEQEDKTKRVSEYADWSIGRFVRMAEQKPWFGNTLFVFVADHGASIDHDYDLSLAYNRVPLIFYAPGRIEPHYVDRLAQQIDIAPTILGLLGIDNSGKMMGVDLMHVRRPFAFFSADDKIGVVDGELFYLYRAKQEGRESLYRYKERSTEDIVDRHSALAADMKRYAFGIIQASQQMLKEGSTACNK
ncbi:MAG: sulfatase-like hydrolase/transferase [Bacteroidales bacterium]|nr:sulfatase-like hydrolase/transferase [Bacteroidales bacterium]